ncbi:MAG: amidohydrolase family protein, partial [bacterium]
MRALDLHAHLTPQCFQHAVRAGQTWHGMTTAEGELSNPMNAWTPEQMTLDYPDRFAGLATLPMQDIPAAVAELERAVVQLGLKGAMINDQVNGRTFDQPEFMPFWRAAEQMGALLFIHQA